MNKIRIILDKIIEFASIFIFSLMVILVTVQVFMRYVLNNPSSVTEALTRYLFVWLVLTTSTYAFGKREHMCISVVKNMFSEKRKMMVDILIELLTFLFSATVMAYGGVKITSMQMVQMDASLHIPTGLIYSIIPICGIAIMFYCICNIQDDYHSLKYLKGGN